MERKPISILTGGNCGVNKALIAGIKVTEGMIRPVAIYPRYKNGEVCNRKGTRLVYRFANGYGGSVVPTNDRDPASDKHLIVCRFFGADHDNYILDYGTPIHDTRTIYGVTVSKLQDYLKEISELPQAVLPTPLEIDQGSRGSSIALRVVSDFSL